MTPEAPQFETRTRIVEQFCAHENCPINHDTACAIAIIVDTDNRRELEGAAIRVVAFASLTGQPISPALAADVLGDMYVPSPDDGLPF